MTTTRTQGPTREERIEIAHKTFDAAVAALRDSSDWTSFLNQAAKLRRYSFCNLMLIQAQLPGATRCAGAVAWRETFGRYINKGEKALWIYAPLKVSYTPAEIALDPARAGQKKLIGFKVVPVFDVSQTNGKPLAEPPAAPKLLEGEAPEGIAQGLAGIAAQHGFGIGVDPVTPDANGETDFVEKMIRLRVGLSDAQTFKTMLHELAHVLLHAPTVDLPDFFCRGVGEVEAESVAYIVCKHFGVDSGDYSLGYVVGWAARDHEAVARSGERICRAAKQILAVLDPE
jgi:hypothetical protein